MYIYNTLGREKQFFNLLPPQQVRMYVCGVTVYDYCHLGHARCEVAFDVIRRYLLAKKYKVKYVRNITDIDDKIIQRAKKNNETIESLTTRMISAMHEDYEQLGVLPPDYEPRATDFVQQMQELITILINKGYAYVTANGDVCYRVNKFKNYGKLSGKVIADLRSGIRINEDYSKEDLLDFVLWKVAKLGEPSWDSPWGKGRPGWHIECSAMCRHMLGDTLDIHGGGPDLPFPHHENEIAQSEIATGKKLANIWMHVGALQVNHEKMSKSLNNFFTVKQILKQFSGEVLRYFFIASHYRSMIDYADNSLQESTVRLERFYQGLSGLNLAAPPAKNTEFEQQFYEAMDDDFNTPEALAVLSKLLSAINIAKNNISVASPLATLLIKLGDILGILQNIPENYLQLGVSVDTQWIEENIKQRNIAREQGNFTEADRIRKLLQKKGIQLLDGRTNTTWKKIK